MADLSGLNCLLFSAEMFRDDTLGGNSMDRSDLIAEIKKQLSEELKSYRSELENKIPDEQLRQTREFKDSGAEFIKENPWASVAMAALAGFVVARFLYRRSED